MENAIKEKTFFLDKVNFNDIDIIIDFGCANGTILEKINDFLQKKKILIGFDKNENFLAICRQKFGEYDNFIFLSELDKLLSTIKDKKYAILFSSCLHELDTESFENALYLMKNSFIVIIRDMYFDNTKNESIEMATVKKFKSIEQYKFDDFEKQHGAIDNLKNLYHFLLKYSYTANWKSEILENYFSVDYDKICLNLQNFDVIYDEKYTLPFKQKEILDNFGYTLTLPTHRKLIFKRR